METVIHVQLDFGATSVKVNVLLIVTQVLVTKLMEAVRVHQVINLTYVLMVCNE